MQQKNLLTWATCLAAAGLLIGGCSPAVAPTPAPKKEAAAPKAPAAQTAAPKPAVPSPSPKTAAETPRSGGILRGTVNQDTPSFDPHQEIWWGLLTVSQAAMNGLLEMDPADPSWKMLPGLAETWEISKEGSVVTFNLRKGIKWHDGKPFTSADAKFSVERMANPPRGSAAPRKEAFETIAKVEAPDDYKLVITLKYPDAQFLDVIAYGMHLMLPRHIVEPLGAAKIRKPDEVIGTGPFRFKSYQSGVGWELVKNPDYWKKGMPYLDGLKRYIIADGSTRFSAFRTKQIDIGDKSPGLSVVQEKLLKESSESSEIFISSGAVNALWGVWMNVGARPMDDVRVRKAINLGVDRLQIQKLLAETVPPGIIGGLVFPISPFARTADEISKMPGLRQPKDADIAEAKKLMADAGYPNGFELRFVARNRAEDAEAISVVIEALKKINVSGTVRQLESVSYFDALAKHDFVASVTAVGPWHPDPRFTFSNLYVTGGGRNYANISDPRIDKLVEQQSRTPDREARKKLVREAEQLLLDEIIPVAPLFWRSIRNAQWKTVRGYPGFGLTYYEGHRMEDVWLTR
ncbi:MAG: ABC transporter substrate-binding protein [Chloroflexi bacterium]|nr:ABC transporter substrate-binding protein [Chloroflexota bacterium]